MRTRGRPAALGIRLVTLTATALLLVAGAAQARDTLAPAGASDHWLPREDWVKRHWLPFDEYALRAELGLRGRDLEAYLFDDRRTLAALAAVRGIALEPLVARLMAPLRARSSPAHFALMRDRARRVLTQGHLAQHQFFHDYHYLAVRENARPLFGLTPRAYWHERLIGRTPLQIARAAGRTRAQLSAGLDALFAQDALEGALSARDDPVQGRLMLERRRRHRACWLTRPVAGMDRAHPYGEQHTLRARMMLPRTVAQLRADERLIERYRRALPRSCWDRPPPWRGPQVAPQPPEPAVTLQRAAAPSGYVCDLRRSGAGRGRPLRAIVTSSER